MRAAVHFLIAGWARRAGWAALGVVLFAQLFAGGLFHAPRFALFDFYERVLPRLKHANPVVIVEADDAALRALGQWPWPRQTEAQLFAKILAAHPAALGLDIIWPEPDRLSPKQWLKQEGVVPQPVAEGLRGLPDHDRLLAEVLASGPVVVGIGGLIGSGNAGDLGRLAPFRLIGAPSAKFATAGLPEFDSSTSKSADPRQRRPRAWGSVRLSGRRRLVPARAARVRPVRPPRAFARSRTLRLAAAAQWINLYLDNGALQSIGVGPLTFPTQRDGSVWVDFSPHDPRRFVSAVDVITGRVGAERFAQRIVIFAATATGTNDWHLTPVGAMPGAEIHAQLLENILAGQLARRPNWAQVVEPLMTIVLAVLLIAILPRLRPRLQAPIVLLFLVSLGVLGLALWWKQRLLLDVATPAVANSIVFVALLGGQFAEADAQKRRLRREVEQRKLAAARAEGELEAARRIQLGLLPAVGSVTDRRLELDALIAPARQIGGDLYDFFKIGRDRVFFSIADVSGKGVPAALFMALVKSLCKSLALRGHTDIAEIVNRTNREISRDNPEMLFVTMFAGILDLSTGMVEFCNAGHDAPYLLRKGERPRQIPAAGGPPLCTLDEYSYARITFDLEPGDKLCLITDGVTEAMNTDGCIFGRERAAAALAALPFGADAHAVTQELRTAVQSFVDGEEPSDDLTILTLRWRFQAPGA